MKLKLIAAAALVAASAAHAGVANKPGDGSVANAYEMGLVDGTPNTLAVLLNLAPGSSFEEYANFTVGPNTGTQGSATVLTLNLGALTVNTISNFTVEVWDNTHPNGNNLIATFFGNNTTVSLGALAPGQYHLDLSGTATTGFGQYSVSLQAQPVPEPETYALMLAGLGAVGFIARRRKQA